MARETRARTAPLAVRRGAARWRSREEAQKAFNKACSDGDEATLAAVLALEGELAVDVHADNEVGIHLASMGGHVGCMAQLLALTGPRRVDVHADDEFALRGACEKGHLPAVELLLSLDGDRTVDVNAGGGEALQWACERGHMPVAARLLALDDGRAVDVHAGGFGHANEAPLREAAGWQRGATVGLLLAATGRHAPDPAVVRELGLLPARADAVWAGSPLRRGRGVLVASRVTRRRAARAAARG